MEQGQKEQKTKNLHGRVQIKENRRGQNSTNFFFFFYRVTIIGHIIIIFVNFDQRQEQKLGEDRKKNDNKFYGKRSVPPIFCFFFENFNPQ